MASKPISFFRISLFLIFFIPTLELKGECCPAPCSTSPTYSLEVGFLYWQPAMDGLLYAETFDADVSQPDPNLPNKVVKNTADLHHLGGSGGCNSVDWSTGVNATLRADCCCIPWSFLLSGTYYQSDSSISTFATPIFAAERTSFTAPLWNSPNMGNMATSTKGSWSLDFLLLDLLASLPVSICDLFCVTPNFGLRGVWLRQKFAADYDQVAFVVTNGSAVEFLAVPHTQSRVHTSYGAIGFKAGTDVSVPLPCRFTFMANIGASMLYGPVHIKNSTEGYQVEHNDTVGPFSTSVASSFKDCMWRLRSNLETEVGLGYNLCICNCPCLLSATWFYALWFDQNDIYDFHYSAPTTINDGNFLPFPFLEERYGNLQLQGFALRFKFCF